MQNASDKQFKLKDDGLICYQRDPSNPMPGDPVAVIRKGEAVLQPGFELVDGLPDEETARQAIGAWLKRHIDTVLEPLVALQAQDGLSASVQGICARLYEAMGILPRSDLEDLIKDLDPEMRQVLRGRKIRLGPVLVFLPDLNKPAAVRLRGLLWALWRGKGLPAGVPNDGIVSLKVDPHHVNKAFYQAIGYPVYGPRAIRIDMLDRVISAVYDGAKDGKFKAEHKMAEWLGCGIEDLYAVLEAMGHKKAHDPVAQESTADQPKEDPATTEKPAEESAEAPKETPKPELATFYLKKGRASDKLRPPAEKKPHTRKAEKPKKKKDKPKDRDKDKPKIIEIGPKPKAEDSPFAILSQLKVGKDAS